MNIITSISTCVLVLYNTHWLQVKACYYYNISKLVEYFIFLSSVVGFEVFTYCTIRVRNIQLFGPTRATRSLQRIKIKSKSNKIFTRQSQTYQEHEHNSLVINKCNNCTVRTVPRTCSVVIVIVRVSVDPSASLFGTAKYTTSEHSLY